MSSSSATLRRYAMFQIPGWIASIAILGLLRHYYDLDLWVGAMLLGLLLVKDVVLYPWLKKSYARSSASPSARLLGETAVARQRLDPRGYVMVHGELWQARLSEGSEPIEEGTKVLVERDDGLTLIVRAVSATEPG